MAFGDRTAPPGQTGSTGPRGILKPRSSLLRTPEEIIAARAAEGEALPTGWHPLDSRLRRGGIPPGRVVTVGGPPFAGKTTILCQIALYMAASIPVYCLMTDEGDGPAADRLGVMLGVPIDEIESDPHAAAIRIGELRGERSIDLLQPDSDTSTAEELVRFVRSEHPEGPVAIVLDSVQTVPLGSDEDENPRLAVRNAMVAYRAWANAYGWIFFLSSQSNRASYRSRRKEENAEAIASFAESAAVEYLSDVAMVLSLPDEESNVVSVRMVKNRLYRRDSGPREFKVRYDEATGRLLQLDQAEVDAAALQAELVELRPVRQAVREELANHQPLSKHSIADAVNGFGRSKLYRAVDSLERDRAIERVKNPKTSGWLYYLRASQEAPGP